MKRATLLPVLFVSGLLLSGCATSSIESRRSERMSAYGALRPDVQRLVDQGRITVGMPADAVFIAWGKPSEVIRGKSGNGATETWRYYATRARPYQYWHHGPFHARNSAFIHPYASESYNYSLPHLETDYYPQRYLRAEVIFQNDTVQDSWSQLPNR